MEGVAFRPRTAFHGREGVLPFHLMSKRSLFLRITLVLLVVGIAAGVLILQAMRRSENTRYRVYELVLNSRFHRYDAVIEGEAKTRGMDPMLLKAVVWRESLFVPGKVGQDGERGLMQITDAAAGEWAKAEKIASFVPADLFDPAVNIKAGSWLLSRALRRYQDRDDPVPFALAEYNAGRSRVTRWSGEKDRDNDDASSATNSKQLQANIDIPSTRHYVETVLTRVRFYRERGRL